MMGIRLKLSSKLLLVSLVILLLPWLGVRYLQAVEDMLQQQQAQSMATIAKASAALITSAPELIIQRDQLLQIERSVANTSVIDSLTAFQIDGYQDDWSAYQSQLIKLSTDNQLAQGQTIDPQDLLVRYNFAQYGQSLNLLLDIVDDSIVFRDSSRQARHGGDAIVIALVDKQQRVRRYILSSSSFGQINAFEYIGSYLDPLIIERTTAIQAAWQKSSYGYQLEITLPLAMIESDIALAIIDSDRGQSYKQVIGLGNVNDRDLFTCLLLPSKQLSALLGNMAEEGIRLWLVDRRTNLMASAGQGRLVMNEPEINSVWGFLVQLLLNPTRSDDESLSHQQALLSSNVVAAALNGIAKTERRQLGDDVAVTVTASQPILVDGDVKGAVVVEQNTNGILALQNKAITTLLLTTAVVFVTVVIILFGFASRLSFRIRRLNKDVSIAVSGDGRLLKKFTKRNEYDELGELRNEFERLFYRLAGYTQYLEALSARLAHELRTPIAVIKTSLEHLSSEPDDRQTYIKRAREGSDRLSNIVARMSEASRLEQTVSNVSLSQFDLAVLLQNVIPTYRDIYEGIDIKLEINDKPVIITGSEELIVQMLDKLISNAIDFHQSDSSIEVSLDTSQNHCVLKVRNTGTHLPSNMHNQLFQAMVSIRPKSNTTMPHLGLGLYVVNLIVTAHSGTVEAKNWQDGVEFYVTLPITGS